MEGYVEKDQLVSFKIKGPPEDLDTTVNPIKTLTPRFITRTLEQIKKTN